MERTRPSTTALLKNSPYLLKSTFYFLFFSFSVFFLLTGYSVTRPIVTVIHFRPSTEENESTQFELRWSSSEFESMLIERELPNDLKGHLCILTFTLIVFDANVVVFPAKSKGVLALNTQTFHPLKDN